MELDDFITKTINSIIKGVKDSQEYAKTQRAVVNPALKDNFESHHRKLTNVDFEIAITASNEKEKGVSGGISVMSLGAGGKSSNKNIENSTSKVRFELAIGLPLSNYDMP